MTDFKLLSFSADGATKAGVFADGRVYEIGDLLQPRDGADWTTVLGTLNAWDTAEPDISRRLEDVSKPKSRSLSEIRLLAPILFPGAYFCAASNYYGHSREMNPGKEITREGKQPYFFVKSGRHTTIGPGEPLRLPKVSEKVDWELELGAVIGKPAKNLSTEEALSCVAGYTILNDVSARDLARRTDWPFVTDWFGQKTFDDAMPMGPWIVPARQIGDPQDLTLKTWINGTLMQDSNTSDMIFSLAEQIEYLTRRVTLYPGDVVATGTPAGVGSTRGQFLRPGDVIQMEIGKIGSFTTPVIEDDGRAGH